MHLFGVWRRGRTVAKSFLANLELLRASRCSSALLVGEAGECCNASLVCFCAVIPPALFELVLPSPALLNSTRPCSLLKPAFSSAILPPTPRPVATYFLVVTFSSFTALSSCDKAHGFAGRLVVASVGVARLWPWLCGFMALRWPRRLLESQWVTAVRLAGHHAAKFYPPCTATSRARHRTGASPAAEAHGKACS